MTDVELVLSTDHGAVRVLTLNRPQARNALNRGLIRALYTALNAADGDASVRAVVLTGTDPAFPTWLILVFKSVSDLGEGFAEIGG